VAWAAFFLWPSPLVALGAATICVLLVGPVRAAERRVEFRGQLRADALTSTA